MTTSCPTASSFSARCDPIKPAPPVTRIRIREEVEPRRTRSARRKLQGRLGQTLSRSDGLGSRRFSFDGWEAVTPGLLEVAPVHQQINPVYRERRDH